MGWDGMGGGCPRAPGPPLHSGRRTWTRVCVGGSPRRRRPQGTRPKHEARQPECERARRTKTRRRQRRSHNGSRLCFTRSNTARFKHTQRAARTLAFRPRPRRGSPRTRRRPHSSPTPPFHGLFHRLPRQMRRPPVHAAAARRPFVRAAPNEPPLRHFGRARHARENLL